MAISFDLAESFAIQTQRHGRIERADSTHETVFVYQLIANNSWDEVAQKIIEKKRTMTMSSLEIKSATCAHFFGGKQINK